MRIGHHQFAYPLFAAADRGGAGGQPDVLSLLPSPRRDVNTKAQLGAFSPDRCDPKQAAVRREVDQLCQIMNDNSLHRTAPVLHVGMEEGKFYFADAKGARPSNHSSTMTGQELLRHLAVLHFARNTPLQLANVEGKLVIVAARDLARLRTEGGPVKPTDTRTFVETRTTTIQRTDEDMRILKRTGQRSLLILDATSARPDLYSVSVS